MGVVIPGVQKKKAQPQKDRQARTPKASLPPTPQAGRRSKTVAAASKKNLRQAATRKKPVGPGTRAGATKDLPMVIDDDEYEGILLHRLGFFRNSYVASSSPQSLSSIYSPLPRTPSSATRSAQNHGLAHELHVRPSSRLAYDPRTRQMSIYIE